MSADEDSNIVAYLNQYLREMQPGQVLHHPTKPKYFLYWNRLGMIWFIIIKIQERGKIDGRLRLLDMSKPIQAECLVANVAFNPIWEPPFTLLFRTHEGEAFTLSERRIKGGLVGAKAYVEAYLAHACAVFAQASDGRVQSEFDILRSPEIQGQDPRPTGVGNQATRTRGRR